MAALLLLASCAQTGGRRSTGSLDDGLLQYIDEASRAEIQDARMTLMEASDQRAAAEYRVEHANGDRGVLKAEKRAASEKVKLERERVAAMTDVETGTEAPQEAQDALTSAVRELTAAENRIELHEAQAEVLKAELALAKAEEDHAEAVVNVWKARAIKDLGNEESSAIDVFAYESEEHECTTEIEIAKIRLWSAQTKVQNLEDQLAAE
ncbi:MAG: hypothetical protein AAGG01_03580 [Planctomycetota bacterium]